MSGNPVVRLRGVADRLASPRVALGFGLLYLALLVAVLPLPALAHQFTPGWVSLLIWVPFAGVGVLVAFRQPRNPIGWITLLLALCFMIGTDASAYSVAAYRAGHHGLPLARLAVFLTAAWIGFVLLLPLPILLFPDGHLPSPRWRWTLRLYPACAAVFVVGSGISGRGTFTDRRMTVDSSGALAHTSTGGLVSVLTAGLFVIYASLDLSTLRGELLRACSRPAVQCVEAARISIRAGRRSAECCVR